MQMYKKISKAEYKCPHSFPPEVRRLLKRILDPNPNTRISMKKIMENSWFKKGLNLNSKQMKDSVNPDFQPLFEPKKPDFSHASKVSSFNAFDIISLSTGFDLSGLFVENDRKEEVKFTSAKPASDIISKMEQIATSLKMEVCTKKDGQLNLKKPSGSQNGPLLIDVEIFEITSSFHLVELKKSSGDAFEYRKLFNQDVKPALQELVWAWHGE
ncbi:putative non-specific serine/threonine protein kinase [Helianthus anomalus]